MMRRIVLLLMVLSLTGCVLLEKITGVPVPVVKAWCKGLRITSGDTTSSGAPRGEGYWLVPCDNKQFADTVLRP